MAKKELAKRNELNVPYAERVLSLLSGGLLLLSAVNKKKGFGLLQALSGGYMLYRGYTGNCPVYAALDKPKVANPVKNLNIRVSMLINKPRKEVYAYWRNLENLPRFMSHLEEVVDMGNNLSRWKAKVPGDIIPLEWEASIVKEEKNSLIGWQSLVNSSVQNAGKVEFLEAGRNATELNVVISYIAPLGAAGAAVMHLFNNKLEELIRKDILNFKDHFEQL